MWLRILLPLFHLADLKYGFVLVIVSFFIGQEKINLEHVIFLSSAFYKNTICSLLCKNTSKREEDSTQFRVTLWANIILADSF